MFIMVDGIDGSGKSTILKAWKEYLAENGYPIFDLKQYWLDNGRYPEYRELKSYEFIFSAEPTNVGVGKVIREELIRVGTNYPPQAVAEAYSLDRLVLYNKIIVPAIADGKVILQDRGVSTSLCYQPITEKTLTESFLKSLPGNALALENRPDHLILADVNPKTAIERLTKRHEKQDNVIFEHVEFQTKAAERFASPSYQSIFSSLGTSIHNLPGDAEIGIMKEQSVQLLKKLLEK